MTARVWAAFLTWLLGAPCPLCGQRQEVMSAHFYVDHYGEDF